LQASGAVDALRLNPCGLMYDTGMIRVGRYGIRMRLRCKPMNGLIARRYIESSSHMNVVGSVVEAILREGAYVTTNLSVVMG